MFGHEIHLLDIPENERNPGFCPCESAYCGHHGGNMATAQERLVAHYEGAAPECGPCTNVPEGHYTMDWLGVICDECAFVNDTYCHLIITTEQLLDRRA